MDTKIPATHRRLIEGVDELRAAPGLPARGPLSHKGEGKGNAMKTYQYAVIPSMGCYGSGETVRADLLTDDLDRARATAAKLTRNLRSAMARHGGTSGGSRVIAWGRSGRVIGLGHDADRIPSI